ncbi:hypothetical protein PSTG_18824, partial [Puccinia striiformis f. sp. tritici PST-78]
MNFENLNDLLYANNNLTAEEERQLEDFLGADINELGGRNDSKFSFESSGEDMTSSDDSDFEGSDNEPLSNLRFGEYLNETPEAFLAEEEPELESTAIGPNRGAKYVGQGRGNGTVWWSQSASSERVRTELAETLRRHSIPVAKKQYANKIDVFNDVFPRNIIEVIALKTTKNPKECMLKGEIKINIGVKQMLMKIYAYTVDVQ